MHGPERLMLDWIIGVATKPELFPRDSRDQMEDFGLTKNQQDVLLTQDSTLIREWVAYEIGVYSTVTHWAVPGTHGLPPPPPPPSGDDDDPDSSV